MKFALLLACLFKLTFASAQNYAPCDHLHNQSIPGKNGLRITYDCWNKKLTATDYNDKVKWTIRVDRFSDSYIGDMKKSGQKDLTLKLKCSINRAI